MDIKFQIYGNFSFLNYPQELSVTASQEEGEEDATHELPQQATHDPPLPATSNGELRHPEAPNCFA